MPYAMGTGNAVAVPVKKKKVVARTPNGTVVRRPVPAPRQPGKAVVPRGVNTASKAYKAGRLIRVGGLPLIAGTAAWELAMAGKRNKEDQWARGLREESKIGPSGYVETKMVPSVQAAAKRRTTTLDERREQRMKTGTFKGKHYGPDEFKGDIKMLKAYRSAGSPKDREEFAKTFKKVYGTGKGWQGTQNKGQGAGDQWRKELRVFKDGKWTNKKPNVRLAKAKGSREPGR